MKILLIIFVITVVLIIMFGIVCYMVFDDDDPDMDYLNSYTPVTCLHIHKTDVTVKSTVTCETIQTICDDCGEVIKTRTEC